jgi:5'-nucleotidase / UDP-sugar diphosphatase
MPHRLLTAALSRRLLLSGAVTSAVATLVPGAGNAQEAAPLARVDATIIVLSDLHSPYGTLANLLAAVTKAVSGVPLEARLILINGDCFERGNVVALRSSGAADWAFLEALTRLAPVVLNIGNHETALVDDLASVVSRMREIGITVVSNIIDTRTGKPFAAPAHRLMLRGKTVAIAAIATDLLPTYRQVVRQTLSVPEPVAYASSTLQPLLAGADLRIILSHAGLAADKAFWNGPADADLTVGGHDHLTIRAGRPGSGELVHVGAWGTRFGVYQRGITATGQDAWRLSTVDVDRTMPADGGLAQLISAQREMHLKPEDRAILATLPRALPLNEAALVAAEAIRRATNADVGLISHTTMGTGLPAGAVSQYDFDAFIRFDGDLRQVDVPGTVLARILARANQNNRGMESMTGDFVYARELQIDPAATYKIGALGWVAMNQQAYLGISDLAFQPVPGLKLKPVVAEALARL